VGPVDHAWTVMAQALAIEHGMGEPVAPDLETIPGLNFTGMLSLTLEAAVEWARTVCASGRRPIEDPKVRQRLAQVFADIEYAKLLSGPVGRVVSSELLIRDSADLLDLIGREGLIRRGERGAVANGWIEYAHRFAQGTAIYGGTTDIHRSIIAEQYLGLPRTRLG
jgi:3-oxocholest-4-en-26-oyl-CoA dehydrogenase alpha subunit